MAELERDLRSLAAAVAWPPAPDFASRLDLRRRRLLLRPAALAFAVVAVAALAAALAVPQSRSAILRFFHLRGETMQRVNTLPRAEERPLAAGLGGQIGDARAASILGGP